MSHEWVSADLHQASSRPIGVFSNSYAEMPDRFFARLSPTRVEAPRVVAFNRALAEDLGLGHEKQRHGLAQRIVDAAREFHVDSVAQQQSILVVDQIEDREFRLRRAQRRRRQRQQQRHGQGRPRELAADRVGRGVTVLSYRAAHGGLEPQLFSIKA